MTVLTAVMIAGVITIVALLVIRLQQPPPPLALPSDIALPDGVEAEAVTLTRDGRAVVLTGDGRVLLYDAAGALAGEARITGTP